MTWAPDYCTTTQLADYMRIGDTADDVQLALAITAASRAIDRACNRQFGQVATATDRYYTAVPDARRCRWLIAIDDLQDDTGLTVAYDSGDDLTFAASIDSYRLLPLNAAADGRPWTEIMVMPTSSAFPGPTEGAVKVHGLFGWSAVPDAIVEATLLQASRFMVRRDSPYGVAGSPDTGSEMRLLAKVDPDVLVALGPYRRWWGAR